MKIFVNGELMRGLSMHKLLTDAEFIREASTAPIYRLFSIDDQYPAMVMALPFEDGYSIPGEIYHIPEELWPRIAANERRLGLYPGPIWLADGQALRGILSVRELCEGYEDISRYGGWRIYCETKSSS
ncbi:MAG: gamma-glutamylcyclotransferase [Firmicutes bacterium]|jgi:gamma-glutamylcyclotransferase (GGCT)/AIG2-like uncharacterized protein YtfP|uniref:Gamma-glutamylcyclotransferase n=1 Tax=Sulfobacillus benefaciens TaxID=453960 RepID=A0A2T2X910_9FIRM|nr:gamma-glutamylcyclotransferase [Bacillota bacterium]PSR30975.1 MAG: gamma-glutamylcyclotransferase [Sulfobacillus benefaciens]